MAEKDWKPKGYTSVSAYLVASNAQQVIDFAKAAFGATELRRYGTPDGKVMHAEFRIDDTVVMVADGNEQFPPRPVLLHVYVPNVDEVYARALKAGGTAEQEPKTRDGDPDKRGSVLDPCGNSWSISTQQ